MDTLVFLDPDNGFETRTQRGPKWVRHAEDPQFGGGGLPAPAAAAMEGVAGL